MASLRTSSTDVTQILGQELHMTLSTLTIFIIIIIIIIVLIVIKLCLIIVEVAS